MLSDVERSYKSQVRIWKLLKEGIGTIEYVNKLAEFAYCLQCHWAPSLPKLTLIDNAPQDYVCPK